MRILLFFLLAAAALPAQTINRKTFDRFSHYDPFDWITYANGDDVTAIDMGQTEIYFATREGGILRYNLYDQEWQAPFTTSNGLRSNAIYRLVYEASSNQLFAQSDKGIDVYNEGFGYWTPSTRATMPARVTVEHTSKTWAWEPYARPPLSEFSSFFIQRGYTLFEDERILDRNRYSYQITDRLVDFQRTLWLGTNGAGVGRANLVTSDMRFERRGPSFRRVRDAYLDGKRIWMAGGPAAPEKAAIVRYNRRKDRWSYFFSGINFNILSSEINVIDRAGNLILFGSDRGLFGYNGKKRAWQKFTAAPLNDDAILDIAPYGDKAFIATVNGLFLWQPGQPRAKTIGQKILRQRAVNKIRLQGARLYIATDQGLFTYDAEADTLSFLQERSAIPTNFTKALAIRSDSLWFANRFGVGLFDMKNDTWRSFPFDQMNFFPHVYDMALQDDNLWLATDLGLLKYDTYRDYWYLYTVNDGLSSNVVYHVDVEEDVLWLSTDKGLCRFKWYDEQRYE